MEKLKELNCKTFYVVGISYKKADAHVRGKFSLTDYAKDQLLQQAKQKGIDSLFVISTCNRTELYGFANHPYELIQLLCDHSNGGVEDFTEVGYIYKNKEAVNHLFVVGTGLDSQILGDFEIISQIRKGFLASKNAGLINNYLERLVNSVIQASKRVKNETKLSSGSTSVSFASVQYILDQVKDVSSKNILLFGTGKIGRNTCENLIKHTKNTHITLINRTKSKAQNIAGKFNVVVKDFEDINLELQTTDVLIVATGSFEPTITSKMLPNDRPMLILDLSIPKNVDVSVLELPLVEVVHLDFLSKITDKTLKMREQYIPKAYQIIEQIIQEFYCWANTRLYAPTIVALKQKLEQIKAGELDYHRKKMENFDCDQADVIASSLIQKITTQFASHLKDENTQVDLSIQWIEKVFQIQTNSNE